MQRNRWNQGLRESRVGFTLVELLVVIGIIAILVSLLLPAVNASRNAARRIICASNLRQVGLALIQYEQSYKQLPPAGLVERPEDGRCGFFFDDEHCFNPRKGLQIGWIPLILPFMEEQTLHDNFNFKRDIFSQQNLPQSQHLPTLLCPADEADRRFLQDSTLTNGIPFAKGNFAGYVSPSHVEHAEILPGALGGFRPGDRQGQELKKITDGTSRTLALSEVRTRDEASDQRGAWALPWTAATILSLDTHHDQIRCPPAVDPNDPDVTFFQDASLITTFCPQDSEQSDYYFRIAQTPNNPPFVIQSGNLLQFDTIYACEKPESALTSNMPCKAIAGEGFYSNPSWLSAAPRSLHTGGVNTFMLDGHVTFIRDEIDHVTMAYLILTNDGTNQDRLDD